MSAKERLLNRVGSIIEKTAAAILWKYVDPDGGVFYMEERRLSTTRSPFTGKSFTAKPVRQTLTDVAKELRAGEAKIKSALWKYIDPEGGSFYCDKRLVGSIKSPITGKTFPAKPEKFTLSEVGKELKLDKSDPAEVEISTSITFDFGDGPVPAHKHLNGGGWVADTAKVENTAHVGENARVYDSAFVGGNASVKGNAMVYGNAQVGGNARVYENARVYGTAFVSGNALVIGSSKVSDGVITSGTHTGVKLASVSGQMVIAADILKSGSSHPAIRVITAQYEKMLAALSTEDPTAVMAGLQPEILELANTCTVVAKQLEERIGRP
jgi:carbonic anhydrase/acetyltransferase-like protein (isoleucine patch superfamily)